MWLNKSCLRLNELAAVKADTLQKKSKDKPMWQKKPISFFIFYTILKIDEYLLLLFCMSVNFRYYHIDLLIEVTDEKKIKNKTLNKGGVCTDNERFTALIGGPWYIV